MTLKSWDLERFAPRKYHAARCNSCVSVMRAHPYVRMTRDSEHPIYDEGVIVRCHLRAGHTGDHDGWLTVDDYLSMGVKWAAS